MIRQLTCNLVYNKTEEDELLKLKVHTGEMWDHPPSDIIKQLKTNIKDQLLPNQNNECAYCGLDLGGTSEGQIEHIAPKAKYSDFTFEKENLVMACHFCNGFSKKGNYHTIQTIDTKYNSCVFKLVHPYFDNPNEHFKWVSQDRKILISSLSEKGKYSIKIFELAEPRMCELRAKKIIADIVLSHAKTPQIDDDLILQTVLYKGVN
jgi:uncharacterized protein (TIGR02646 family)